ncbi:hypothetical protein LCGC14_2646600 [marine sediment metagenome]|uniref:Uncharacterized protein n=1 Tax=marine sediment metagenome TaxID=412755 RepID=A0A0F9AID2_9ZZZZ
MIDNTINLETLNKTDIIGKINNVVRSLMNGQIDDKWQNILKDVFAKRKDIENWKNPITSIEFTFTFENYERIIQSVGLLAMAYSHFHGGYELNRIGLTDTVEISSKGYYHYMETE